MTTRRVRLTIGCLAAASFALSSAVDANKHYFPPSDGPQNEFDPSLVEKWKEIDVAPPAYPRDTDLTTVPVGAGDSIRLFVDVASVSRASDFVWRMTLVVESSSGNRNVMFESVRCETRQFKTIAVAPDKTLVRVPSARWQEVTHVPTNNFRLHLFKHLCDDTISIRSPRDFLRRIKYQN